MATYLSVVYDLSQFGIFNINNAIVNSDMDEGIAIEVSFDGGASFYSVKDINKKFTVTKNTGKIQVKITFESGSGLDIYTVAAMGFFHNLEVGTTIHFTKLSNSIVYKTNIGLNGKYQINLPRGKYKVWYKTSVGKDVTLVPEFNPEMNYTQRKRLDKENTVEMFFRDVEWAKYNIFDTFDDKTKMLHGEAIIDADGDLSDGITNRKCRYWSVGFD